MINELPDDTKLEAAAYADDLDRMNTCIVCGERHEGEGDVCHDCEDKRCCGTCVSYVGGDCVAPLPFWAEHLQPDVGADQGEECELWG